MHADFVIAGGGTAGAAVAGLIAERTDAIVALIEAGPDYGPYAGDGWPPDLLNACHLAESHSWNYNSGTHYPDRTIGFNRARVLGGCSSHNGCAAIWGCHLDYDGWVKAGNDGWSTSELLPLFEHASQRLRVRIPNLDEVQPFQQAFLDAAPAASIPIVSNLNDLYEDVGMAPSPANVSVGVRWNAAFAYLDPVREKGNLRIIGNALADRLQIEDGRASVLDYVRNGTRQSIAANTFILSAGTYGSPAILMRSGIGAPDALSQAGIQTVHNLPGVGQNLHDHPAVNMTYAGTERLIDAMTRFMETRWLPEEQCIAKARSSRCNEGFDLHLYPLGGPYTYGDGRWDFRQCVACMTPKSRGALRVLSPDPEAAPVIDHGYLADLEGHDRSVILDGIKLAREMASQTGMNELLGDEVNPGNSVRTDEALREWIDRSVAHYFHPVGTCKMGPATDSMSVVDASGKVHGLENLYVADCSIMPVIPRANTNIPAAVVGERIARWLVDG